MNNINERLRASQDPRDYLVLKWNLALEGGDPDEIAQVADEVSHQVQTRIMDQDPNYRQGGWS